MPKDFIYPLVLSLFFLFSYSTPPVFSADFNRQKINAIYGRDERRFVDAQSSPIVNELSKAVAFIVSEDSVEVRSRTTLITAKFLTSPRTLALCPDENFARHHTVNACTGFLVAPDLVVSAGHCFMSAEDCARKKIIFNMRAENEVQRGYSVYNNAVYECSEIVKNSFNPEKFYDYSLIRLKKKVSGVNPLKFRQRGRIAKGTPVFMIGHPLGLPLIYSGNALVNDIRNYRSFKATLDSFEGNSGSPVFNSKTLEVEGILVRGENDFVENSAKKCYVGQVYDQGSLEAPTSKGEGVTRISEVLPLE